MKKSVAGLMHAFGNDESPLDESVEHLCGMVLCFFDKTLLEAERIAACKGKFDASCLLFVCKRDLMMYKAGRSIMDRRRAVRVEVNKFWVSGNSLEA